MASKRKRSHRPRKGVMPAALKRYWATHSRKRKANPVRHHAKTAHRKRTRRNAMPPALAKYWRTHRHHGAKTARRSRRHRNPMRLPGMGGVFGIVKDSAIQALGSIAIDLAYGQVNKMLPPTMQVTPGAATVGAGDAVKALFTVAAGTLLSRFTRGYSKQAAVGSLTIQLRGLTESFMPATLVQQLAWVGPSPVITGHRWAGPNRMMVKRQVMHAYTRRGVTPLLNAYTHQPSTHPSVRTHFTTPLLSGAPGLPNIGPNLLAIPAGVPIR